MECYLQKYKWTIFRQPLRMNSEQTFYFQSLFQFGVLCMETCRAMDPYPKLTLIL